MPDVRTVVHRDIHFIDTTQDGHRITIAKGVADGKYHGLEASGHNKQKAYDNLLELKAELDRVATCVESVVEVEGWVEAPEYCPGHEDPRCKAHCTVSLLDRNEDGQYKIYDPDCFR